MTVEKVVPLVHRDAPPVIVRVFGDPVAKGSMQAALTRDGRAYTRADNAGRLRKWEASVRSAAELAMLGRVAYPIHTPLRVEITFIVPRPKSYSARVVLPYTRPDIDKLARAVLDALTGPVFGDDGAVSSLLTRKRFHSAVTPGAFIRIELDH